MGPAVVAELARASSPAVCRVDRSPCGGFAPAGLAQSAKTSLRLHGPARFPMPLDWHQQALQPMKFPEGPIEERSRLS